MKNFILLTAILFFSFSALTAQETPLPLPDHATGEFVPEAPTSQHVWVKGHYEYKSGKYYWVEGAYVLGLENHSWVDGEWVFNNKTQMYHYASGYWKNDAGVIMHNGIAYAPGVITNLSTVEMYADNNMLSDATK
ncbi:MAG: YXWGXW repeat-containing protein [Bacteroidetes bacterium]|nr:YXWGXW repeat-containing protein [Bacteroidota bacterium]MCB9227750.1 YXWGXW repeat-containing protein [Chitinophagales bacterium]